MTQDIASVDLQNGPMRLRLLSRGAVTQGWWTDDMPLILGYDDPQAYLSDRYYLGAIVGPVANRIGGARYVHDGGDVRLFANEGANSLHSGPQGLSAQHWDIAQSGEHTAQLSYVTKENEAGFPGRARFSITVHLTEHSLTYDMSAETDCARPVSLAQHNYYTLGASSGADLSLTLPMRHVLALTEAGIATGEIEPVADTPLDFSHVHPLGRVQGGIDRFFIRAGQDTQMQQMATLAAPSGLKLRVSSDQPGAQIYTGHGLGAPFAPWGGVCIEPSGYPNAVNQPEFPSVICAPGRPYRQKLVLELET